MADVAELLGQNDLAWDILESVEPSTTLVTRLTGPAGSGKSHVARLVAKEWQRKRRTCVVALGDYKLSWRDLYPLLSGLAWVHADWAGLAVTGARVVLRSVDTAVGGAGAPTSIFDLVSAAFRQRTDRALRPYSSLERDVILDLRHLARSRRVLVVADNAHWWDADSLRLLQDVLSEPLRTALPRLKAISVLMVDSADDQGVVDAEAFQNLASLSESPIRRTSGCTGDQFVDVLRAFGLTKELPSHVVRQLFRATNGHLGLAEQVAAYVESTDMRTLVPSAREDFLSELFAARLASLGSFRSEVADVLARAAVLGLSFEEQDLRCMAGMEPAQVRSATNRVASPDLEALVERAESIRFIERVSERLSFSHDVIRALVLREQSPAQLRSLYARLAQCLAILRPGDYEARAQALSQAADSDTARDMAALSYVGQLRRGVSPPKVVRRAALRFPDDADLVTYLGVIAEGYAAVSSGDVARTIPRLRTPVPNESLLMAAERDYVAALCCLGAQTKSGLEQGRSILQAWASSLDEEHELRLRFLILLQQAQARAEMTNEARATQMRVDRLLHLRRYDPDATVMLQVQNRRAAALDTPEVAEQRILQAVEFFRRGTTDVVRDRLELYRSLTNLVAIYIRLGKDAEAYARAREAEQLALEFPDMVYRPDVLAGNLLLAAYRCGVTSLTDAIERQKTIVDSPDAKYETVVHRSNLAAYLALANMDDEAVRELQRLGNELESKGPSDVGLIYYWNALTVVSDALAGRTQAALSRHTALDSFLETREWPAIPYMVRRQRRLREVLPSFPRREPRPRLDRLLIDRSPSEIGPAWSNYGRVFPCVALSFLSDS